MRSFKKRRVIPKKIILPIFLFFFIFLFFIFFKSGIFSIKYISLEKENTDCLIEDKIKNESLGLNIFLINEGSITQSIKRNFICVKNIRFSKALPDKLKIDISGRMAAAKLTSASFEASSSSLIENEATPSANGEMYLLDDEGVVFSKGNLDVPEIFSLGKSVSLGYQDNYLKALKILKSLKNFNLDSKQNYIFNNLFITNSTPKIIFKLDISIEPQIASLQLIQREAKINNKDLEFIDLRFDKPVVKYAPKKS